MLWWGPTNEYLENPSAWRELVIPLNFFHAPRGQERRLVPRQARWFLARAAYPCGGLLSEGAGTCVLFLPAFVLRLTSRSLDNVA